MNRRYFLLGAAVVLFAADWLWRDRYDKVVAVHLEVLSAMIEKAAAHSALVKRPSPNDMTELMYPLDRARRFVEENEAEAARSSFGAFSDLVDGYGSLIESIDAVRGTEASWQAAAAAIGGRVDELRQGVARVETLLAAESE